MSTQWYQTVLQELEVVEVNVRVGLVPAQDHLQLLVEAKDPRSGILLAQASMPHSPLANADAMVRWALERALEMVEEYCDPF